MNTPQGPGPDNAIVIRALRKVYRAEGKTPAKEALKRVDLDIPRGSIFGLLGPNGAGKSTLINILANLVIKTGGTAAIMGHDIDTDLRQAKLSIGVVPQELNLDAFFTPREVMELQAGCYGVRKRDRRTDEILDMVGLADQADAYARSLSGGMRRRLLVAKAMVHAPPVLVLDEPTAGVDVDLRRQLWDTVRGLNAAGTTILLTTHYLEEAERLCDRIAIIDHGEVVACDTKAALVRRLDRKELQISVSEPLDVLPEALAHLDAELASPRRIVVRYRPSHTHVGDIFDAIEQAGCAVVDLSTKEAALEDLFLELTAPR